MWYELDCTYRDFFSDRFSIFWSSIDSPEKLFWDTSRKFEEWSTTIVIKSLFLVLKFEIKKN